MARLVVKYISAASSMKRGLFLVPFQPPLMFLTLNRFPIPAGDENAGLGLEEKVVAAGVVMEAFGNAQTARNKNSSRFGKYLKIHFSASGRVQGASAQVYLLEKSRVIHQDLGERNYHIFYQLLASASGEQKRQLKLQTAASYALLNKGNTLTIAGIDDKEEFKKVPGCLLFQGSLTVLLKRFLFPPPPPKGFGGP